MIAAEAGHRTLREKRADPEYIPTFWEKWSPDVQFKLLVYLTVCYIAASMLPNSVWSPQTKQFVYSIGLLGVWRYSWWLTHYVRAKIFRNVKYPAMAARAAALWDAGWRPRHIHVQMTTFREHRATSEAVVRALVREIRDAGVPATIWLGSSERADEQRIARHLGLIGGDCDITLRIIRQNQPGKRIAIALILRAMSRAGLGNDDIVIFMDGDFIIDKGAVRRCFPLFAADPGLHALTTDEHVIVHGPRWVQSMLDLRFAQRRMAMMSHALSGRVITLTGRMSVFRATHIVSQEFIRLQEADFLDHWLWGRFRFLSGDDKSTWYALLKQGVKMTYVPDSSGYTVEHIEGSGVRRMVENTRRWSGNTLRNGARAIALGPWRMPLFIWWVLIDQRLAMWTMLVSPILAIAGSMIVGGAFFLSYLIFLAVSRLLSALILAQYARWMDFNFPWVLYANQINNAAVKVYMLWRLSKQKWTNRGNQRQGFGTGGLMTLFREAMAFYMTFLSLAVLVLAVMAYTRLLTIPNWNYVLTFYGL
ncbi:MAG: glycosyltransferase [Hyphomicrobiaceae bacterium]